MASVAVAIIGDEILRGEVQDSNSFFLAREISALGSNLTRIVVLRDHIPEIASCLLELARTNDLVITSGGIGPTPDDLTFEAVSAAWGVGLELNPQMQELLKDRFPSLQEQGSRMAMIPRGATLLEGGVVRWPLVRFRNIFILPGVPGLLRDRFDLIRPFLVGPRTFSRSALLKGGEIPLVPAQTRILAEHPGISLGSYPELTADRKLTIIIRAREEHLCKAAMKAFLSLVPQEDILAWPEDLEPGIPS